MIIGVTAALVREMLQFGPDSPERRAAVFGDLRARVQGRGKGPATELDTAIIAAWQKGYMDGYEDGVAAGTAGAEPAPANDRDGESGRPDAGDPFQIQG